GMMKNPSYAPLKLAPEIEAFVAASHAEQNAITAAAGFDQRELTINYNLLQISDLLSLFICTKEHIQQHTLEPVPTTYSKDGGLCVPLATITQTRSSIDP